MPNKLNCWWAYSDQCRKIKCGSCYMQYPVLRGLLENPGWWDIHDKKILHLMKEARKKTLEKRNK